MPMQEFHHQVKMMHCIKFLKILGISSSVATMFILDTSSLYCGSTTSPNHVCAIRNTKIQLSSTEDSCSVKVIH